MSANTAAIFDVKLPFVVVPNSGTTVNQNSPSADPVTMRDVLNLDTRNLGQLFDQAVSDGLVHAGQTLFDQPTQGVGQFLDFEPNNLLLGFREGAKPTVTDFVNALEAVDVTSGGVRLQLNNVTGTVDDTTHRVTFTPRRSIFPHHRIISSSRGSRSSSLASTRSAINRSASTPAWISISALGST